MSKTKEERILTRREFDKRLEELKTDLNLRLAITIAATATIAPLIIVAASKNSFKEGLAEGLTAIFMMFMVFLFLIEYMRVRRGLLSLYDKISDKAYSNKM